MTPRETLFVRKLIDGGVLSFRAAAELEEDCGRMEAVEGGKPVWDLAVERQLISPERCNLILREVDAALNLPAISGPAGGDPQQLGGYELLARLGQGGMGVVYKARQKSMDRLVALKILPRNLAQDDDFIARFLREARVAGKLSHLNIVAGIDAGQADGFYYFAMEYVDGRNLAEILRQGGPLPEKDALEFGRQIAEALDYAHGAGLVHRDIKPENVLITPSGQAKLCDLGLARQATGETSIVPAGVPEGTPYYLAPEQVRGERPDHRADVYSLGCTLYHLLSGQPPFQGGSPMMVMRRRLEESPTPLSNLKSGIGRATEAVVGRMMALKPEDRYQSAREVVEDLVKVASGGIPAVLAEAVATRRRDRRRAGRAGTTLPQRTGSARPAGRAIGTGKLTTATRPLPTDKRPGVGRGVASAQLPPYASRDRWILIAAVGGTIVLVGLVSYLLVKAVGKPPSPPPEQRAERPVPETQARLPLPAPGKTPQQLAAERLAALAARFEELQAFEAASPEDFAELVKRYGALAADAIGTDYRAKAEQAVEAVGKRRSAKAAELLAKLRGQVEGGRAQGSFGPVLTAIDAFPAALAAEVQAELAALRAQTLAAGQARWQAALQDGKKLAAAGKYDEAATAIAKGKALGLPELDEQVATALAEVEAARKAAADARTAEAEKAYKKFAAGLSQMLAAGDYDEIRLLGRVLGPKLTPELAKQLNADLALAAGAEGHIAHIRAELVRNKGRRFRIYVPSGDSFFKEYDAKKDALLVSLEAGDASADLRVELNRVARKELVRLTRVLGNIPEKEELPPQRALQAACFLLAGGVSDGVGKLLEVAKAGGEDVADLAARLAVLEKDKPPPPSIPPPKPME